jgi:hypothetical protein
VAAPQTGLFKKRHTAGTKRKHILCHTFAAFTCTFGISSVVESQLDGLDFTVVKIPNLKFRLSNFNSMTEDVSNACMWQICECSEPWFGKKATRSSMNQKIDDFSTCVGNTKLSTVRAQHNLCYAHR